MAARRPRPTPIRAFTQSAFVDKDDRLPVARGVFLTPATAPVSTADGGLVSFERAAGRPLQLHPSPQDAPGVSRGNTAPGIRARSDPRRATRSRDWSDTQAPPGHASGPPQSAGIPSLASCAGRPVLGARFNASRPPSTSCCAQRFTDWRWTPTRRATSASVRPLSRSRAACRRRRSNFTRSNVTPAGCPMPGRYSRFTRSCHYVM